MAEIVNLKRARKAKQRDDKEQQAAQNRLHFGRSKAEKQLTEAEQKKDQRLLDQHQLDNPQDDEGNI